MSAVAASTREGDGERAQAGERGPAKRALLSLSLSLPLPLLVSRWVQPLDSLALALEQLTGTDGGAEGEATGAGSSRGQERQERRSGLAAKAKARGASDGTRGAERSHDEQEQRHRVREAGRATHSLLQLACLRITAAEKEESTSRWRAMCA